MTTPLAAWNALPMLHRGILCMLATTVFFASMDATVKGLSARYDPFFVVWARYASHALGAVLVVAIFAPRLLRTSQPGMQLVRSGMLFVATLFFFSSVALLPLADAIAVAQVAPLMIIGLAALILSEKVGIWRWSGVLVGFVGALVIIRPGTDAFYWEALLPLAGSFFFACYSIATRFLGDRESPWTTFTYTAAVGALLASLALPFVWQTPAVADVPLLILVGVLGAAGQGFLVAAFAYAGAATLAPFLYFNLIWAALYGWFLFGDAPDAWTVSGAVIIVGAGLFVHIRTQRRAREQGGPN